MKKKIMSYPEVILTYSETRSGGEPIDPTDKWTDHETEYIDWRPYCVFVDDDKKKAREKTSDWGVESLSSNKPLDISVGDTVFIVVVRYQTGGTFGCSSGNWQIEGVFTTSEEAFKMKELIQEDNKAYIDSRQCIRGGNNVAIEEKYVSSNGYKCWQGYFEVLESVEVSVFKAE